MESDDLERRIEAMCATADELESAPLETLDEYEGWHSAFETLGHVYNRWLMNDWEHLDEVQP